MDIQQQKKFEILLLGDICIDEYQYGVVERMSPEAPVPIFNYQYSIEKKGMAGNVYNNLCNLNCNVTSVFGKTSRKIRLIDNKSNQHIVRIDNDVQSNPIKIIKDNFISMDAVVISDYNKGSIDYETIKFINNNFNGPVFIDTKKRDLVQMGDAFVKINSNEYNIRTSDPKNIIITLGAKGAQYQDKIFPASFAEVVDVCGAGDTFLAALSYFYLVYRSIPKAIEKAVIASSITVRHSGVYAPTLEEICA